MASNPGKQVVGAEFSKEHVGMIKEIASRRGEDVSSFLRRAVLLELARLSYLKPEEKKALGREVQG